MGCTQSHASAPSQGHVPQRSAAGTLLGSAKMSPEAAMEKFCKGAPAAHLGQQVQMQPAQASTASSQLGGGFQDDSSTVLWSAAGGPSAGVHRGAAPLGPAPEWRGAQDNCSVPRDRVPTIASSAKEDSHCDGDSGTTSVISQARTATSSTTSRRPVDTGSFPERLTPMHLVPTGFRANDFEFASPGEVTQWSLRLHKLGFAARRFLAPQLEEHENAIAGHISEVHSVTLPEEQLRNLGIAREATLFAFSYPVVTAKELQITEKDARVADVAFLVFGGFMYFDSDMVLQDIRAVMPAEDGSLRFAAPQPWASEWTSALPVDRWNPVTIPALRDLGVRYFSWLLPGELVEGHDEPLSHNGGFAYLFHEPSEVGVLQARLDVFFEVGDETEDESQGKPCPKCWSALEWSDYCQGVYAAGWDCEHFRTCGRARTPECPSRWFCSSCKFDICQQCHASS